MSLFLQYFDNGHLRLLAGCRWPIFYDDSATLVTCGGERLASSTLAICYQFSSDPFRTAFDPELHRELCLFLCERIAAGKVPHLFFHWGDAETVDVTSVVEVKVRDAADLFEILHGLSDDRVVRITEIVNPVSRTTQQLLAEMLVKGTIPWFDGILFGDGSIIIMEHWLARETQGGPPIIRPLVRSTLDAFLRYNSNRWRSMEPLKILAANSERSRLTCGKGKDWDATGFVAVGNVDDGGIQWVASFQDSGAFTDVAMDKTEVVAHSAGGHVWRFPIEHPELVQVSASDPFGNFQGK